MNDSIGSGKIEDLMVREVVTVSPDTSLVEAAALLTTHDFTGLPVVDREGKLIGLLTEFDLISRGTMIHLPTLAKLLKDFKFYKDDKDFVLPDIQKILNLKVKEVMNSEPMTLSPSAPLEEAVALFAEHHAINPVPIVDENRKLLGVLARFNIVKFFSASGHAPRKVIQKSVGKTDVDTFLSKFEENFVLVSEGRTHWWLLASILAAIVGFIIAFALILRLTA